MSSHRYVCNRGVLALMLVLAASIAAGAQTTAFTYQGKLTDAAAAANGSYDMRFALFDQLAGGTQQPQPGPVTLTRTGVTVTNGIFTVQLDFGVTALTGDDRFLDISVKKNANPTYTSLVPRQQLTSSPYAIQTLNASLLGGVDASQYVQTTDTRLSNARPASSVDFGNATLTSVVPIANGGTGSAAKNFVDLTTSQLVMAQKTFSSTSNAFSGDGSALTLGQNATTYSNSSTITVPPGVTGGVTFPSYTATVPGTSLIVTDGQVNVSGSGSETAFLEVSVSVDGTTIGEQGLEISDALGPTTSHWSFSAMVPVAAGTHTIALSFRNVLFPPPISVTINAARVNVITIRQ